MVYLYRNSKENCRLMFYFLNVVCSFMNYVIFCELCDWMQFEVDCAKSHHHVIREGLLKGEHTN